MAIQKCLPSEKNAVNKRNDSVHLYPRKVFLLKKSSFNLTVTLSGRSVSVAVSACRDGNEELAADVARIQEKLSNNEVQRYTGNNLYAFLLTVYSKQNWQIQEIENGPEPETEKHTNNKRGSS